MDVRYGPHGPSDWTKFYREGTSAGAAPALAREAARCEARRVEWVMRKPAALTAYTVHWGRWVVLPGGLEKWVEVGRTAVVGASALEEYIQIASHETHGDAIAAYADGFTGSPTDPVQFWFRAIP